MAGQTTYYQLETYESTDVPDLRDQYNSSMAKIDGALNTIANTATSAAQGVAGAVQNAQPALHAAANALTAAQNAQTAAQTASSDAAAATAAASDANSNAQTALSAANSANVSIIQTNERVTALEGGSVLLVDSGSFAAQVPANSYADFPITYETNFPDTPGVYLCISTGSTAVGMGNFQFGTVNESVTGCTIRCWNNDGTGRSPRIRWFAERIIDR